MKAIQEQRSETARNQRRSEYTQKRAAYKYRPKTDKTEKRARLKAQKIAARNKKRILNAVNDRVAPQITKLTWYAKLINWFKSLLK